MLFHHLVGVTIGHTKLEASATSLFHGRLAIRPADIASLQAHLSVQDTAGRQICKKFVFTRHHDDICNLQLTRHAAPWTFSIRICFQRPLNNKKQDEEPKWQGHSFPHLSKVWPKKQEGGNILLVFIKAVLRIESQEELKLMQKFVEYTKLKIQRYTYYIVNIYVTCLISNLQIADSSKVSLSTNSGTLYPSSWDSLSFIFGTAFSIWNQMTWT